MPIFQKTCANGSSGLNFAGPTIHAGSVIDMLLFFHGTGRTTNACRDPDGRLAIERDSLDHSTDSLINR